MALNVACPAGTSRGKRKPVWWNNELQSLRSSSRRLFNEAKRTNLPESWQLYKCSLSIYKTELRKSKRNSWKSFCESVENVSETARFRKIISKSSNPTGFLQRDNGEWALSSEESLEILLNSHFPPSQETSFTFSSQGLEGRGLAEKIVTRKKVEWAISNFQPFKSPGLDGIIRHSCIGSWTLPAGG